MKLLFLGTPTLALLGLFSLSPQAADTFDVVAIHPSRADSMNTQIALQPGGRLVVTNATLRTLLRNAYGVLPFQLTGEPKWSEVERFDINAKNATGHEITQDSLKPLLQGLLADRFHLKAHWETREMPVFALIVERDGPRFQPHAEAPGQGMNTRRENGKVDMRGTDVPMSDLASNLAFRLNRYVVDQTGLTGHYDFALHWNPDVSVEDTGEPSLSSALHEQLGLKLESRKDKVEVLVIDLAEKPTEN